MIWLRRVATAAAWVAVAALALVASFAYHGRLPLARRAARDVVNAFVSKTIQGRLHIGRVDALGPGRIVTRHVSLYDAQGRRVAVADEVDLVPDLLAALDGTLRFASVHLHHGTVHLIQGQDLPTLIELFAPTAPPSPGPGLHAIVDDIRLDDVTVYGEMLGLRGLRVDHLRLHWRLEASDHLHIQFYSASGDIVKPFPFVGHIDRFSGTVCDEPHLGVRLHVEAHAGTDRARANVVFAVPADQPDQAPAHLDLLVHAMPVRARTLRQMGFDWAENLRGTTRGFVRLYGPVDDLRLRAQLQTDAGRASLGGHFPSGRTAELHASTPGLDLARLVADAPDVHVAGRASLQVPPEPGAHSRAHLDLEPFRYRGYHVPALDVRATLEDDGVRVDRAVGRQGSTRVSATGSIAYDGKVDMNVRAVVPQVAREPNLRKLFPGARARLDGDVHIVTATAGPERLDFRGHMVLRHLTYGPLTADWLAIDGFARGDPDHPEAKLAVKGRGVALADYPLGKADLSLRGGPHHYVLAGKFAAPGERRLELDADIDATRDQYLLHAHRIEFAVGDLVWRGSAEQVAVHPKKDVVIDRLLLANGSQRLEAKGTWRFQGPEHIEAQLQGFDLAALHGIFGDAVPALTGNADAHLVLQGDIDQPQLLLEGALRDATYHGVHDANLAYVFTYKNGRLSLDAQADLEERGNLAVTASGLIDPSEATMTTALQNGVYDVDLALSGLDIGVLRDLLGPGVVPPMEGKIGGHLKASGPIQAPSFSGTLEVPALTLPGWPAMAVRTELSYENGALNGSVVTSDEHGELAEVHGSLLLDLIYVATHPNDALPSLQAVPWRMSMKVPARTLAELPEPLKRYVPASLEPLRVALNGTLAGGSFKTRGDWVAQLGWDEDLSRRPCGKMANPQATIALTLRGDTTQVKMVGRIGNRQVLVANGSATTPLDDWLSAGEISHLPSIDLSVDMNDLDLGQVPGACETFAGPISGKASLTGMLTDRPELHGSLSTEQLVIRRFRSRGVKAAWTVAYQTPPLRGAVEFDANRTKAHASANLKWTGGGTLDMVTDLPIAWDVFHPVPGLAEGSAPHFDANLHQVPLALLLASIPNLVQVEGTVSGHLATSGTEAEPGIRGRLKIRDGYFELMPMGQQIGDLTGDLVFHGNWVELTKLVAHEQEGKLTIRGALHLAGLKPKSARLVLQADKFPVRSEGAILVRATGKAVIDADVTLDKTIARAVLSQLSLTLPDESPRTVQELEPHPDVHIVGAEAPQREEGEAYPIVLTVKSEEPFWVRRSDFAALVAVDLGITYLDPDLYVDGSLQIRRGFFEVFGKRFDVQQAGLQFTGGKQINPEVTLRAVHSLRSGSADTVTVTVTGRLANPQVDFSTSVAECQEQGEVIALLVTGRCGRSPQQAQGFDQAGRQAADFLAGVAYGVLTLSARQQLGKNFPVIVIESGQGGRPVVRAGIDASDWIPKFLRPYVRGVYVEGFFTAASKNGQQQTQSSPTVQGRDNGFLMELQFPYNIVGTGVFSPPDAWSVDLTWEP